MKECLEISGSVANFAGGIVLLVDALRVRSNIEDRGAAQAFLAAMKKAGGEKKVVDEGNSARYGGCRGYLAFPALSETSLDRVCPDGCRVRMRDCEPLLQIGLIPRYRNATLRIIRMPVMSPVFSLSRAIW